MHRHFCSLRNRLLCGWHGFCGYLLLCGFLCGRKESVETAFHSLFQHTALAHGYAILGCPSGFLLRASAIFKLPMVNHKCFILIDVNFAIIWWYHDNIGDLVPLYRRFGIAWDVASSGASRPLGGAAPLGVFHWATLLEPMGTTYALQTIPSSRYYPYHPAIAPDAMRCCLLSSCFGS